MSKQIQYPFPFMLLLTYLAGCEDINADLLPDSGIMDAGTDSGNGGNTCQEAFPSINWISHSGGPRYDWGYHMAAGAGDAIFIAGAFKDDAKFNIGTPGETSLSTQEAQAFFINRINSQGDLDWAVKIDDKGGNDLSAHLRALDSFQDETLVIGGAFLRPITLGSVDGSEVEIDPNFTESAFLAKYGKDGKLSWAKVFKGEISGIMTIKVISDDSFLVTGYYYGSLTLGEGEASEITFDDDGIFLAQYSTDGSLVWAVQATGAYRNMGTAIAVLADESIVLSGYCLGPTVFGPGEPNETTLELRNEIESKDVFLARYTKDGALLWAEYAIAAPTDEDHTPLGVIFLYDMAVDSKNNILLVGEFWGQALFNPESEKENLLSNPVEEIYIVKYSSDGDLLWVSRAGSDSEKIRNYATSVSVLPDDSLLVLGETGWFDETIVNAEGDDSLSSVFGKGEANETTVVSSGLDDIFLSKYNSTGQLEWVVTAGGAGNDSGQNMDISDDGTIYITGFYSDDSVWSDCHKKVTLSSEGEADVFVASLELN